MAGAGIGMFCTGGWCFVCVGVTLLGAARHATSGAAYCIAAVKGLQLEGYVLAGSTAWTQDALLSLSLVASHSKDHCHLGCWLASVHEYNMARHVVCCLFGCLVVLSSDGIAI